MGAGLHPSPLMRPSEAGGFGLVDGGGVEFAVGGVYDGFVVVYVEREVVDFFSGRSVGAVLGYVWVGAGGFCIILPLAQSDGYFYKRLRLVL